MNIYHSTQEWDKLNQSLSDIFEVEYQPMAMPVIDTEKAQTHIPSWNKGLPALNKGLIGIYKHTNEAKAKMSAAGKGRKKPMRSIQMMGENNINYGKPRSAETKSKISAKAKGRTHTAEEKAKMSAAGKGRPKSAEHKAAISAALLRRKALLSAE